MDRGKKLKLRAQPVPVYHHHDGIVSVKLRVTGALAFRKNIACSSGNGLGYQEGVKLFD